MKGSKILIIHSGSSYSSGGTQSYAGTELRFYNNFPLPPKSHHYRDYGVEKILGTGRIGLDKIENVMSQIRELFDEPDLEITDIVRGATVIIPEGK